VRAEIISIGDELTSGQRLDTNSQWLSERLGELGIPVVAHATVADDLAANVEIFRQAVDRAEIVISTGGLGPTADDLTREAIAQMTGLPLILDPAALEHIRGLFARRKREMPERNVVQAMFPQGSRVIDNPEGTAPGIDMDVAGARGKSRIFALPGVPVEMKQMWHQSVLKSIMAMGGGERVIRHKRIKCFGVGESALEQMLPDLIRRGRDPSVGITVHEGTITLRVTASAPTGPECHAAMEATSETIHECLGLLVYGYEDNELHHIIARLLAETGKTLAVCEWGTAGLVTQWLGEAGCGEWFRGGVTIGGLSSATALDVDPALATHSGGNPAALVTALAESVCRRFAADYGLAIGELPKSGNVSSPTEVHFALASEGSTVAKSSPAAAHSAIVKPLAAKAALNFLRLALVRQV